MKLKLLVLALFLTLTAFAQRRKDQFSLEAGYGFGISGKPISTEFKSFNGGVRWMWNDYWGVKGDIAYSAFRYDHPEPQGETGTNYYRTSLQVVYNLGRALDWSAYVDNVNVLAHAGAGYSFINGVNAPAADPVDSMGNVIFGITPQVYLSKRVTLHADWSYIVNFSQHRDYDGSIRHTDRLKRFTGGLSTLTVGLSIYIGRYKSDRDWR